MTRVRRTRWQQRELRAFVTEIYQEAVKRGFFSVKDDEEAYNILKQILDEKQPIAVNGMNNGIEKKTWHWLE